MSMIDTYYPAEYFTPSERAQPEWKYPDDALYTVKIRREGWRPVRPEAEQIDGKTFIFSYAWSMDDTDPYPGEEAWEPRDPTYPKTAPLWIASGDLVLAQPKENTV